MAASAAETFDDGITRAYLVAALAWGVAAMLVGIVLALELLEPLAPNVDRAWLAFGRLRPVHTNAVVFGFVANAAFAGTTYAAQRLLAARLWSDVLSRLHLWGWQLVVMVGVVVLPAGLGQPRALAEMPWTVDLALAAVWAAFAANLFATVAIRRERRIYAALWFILASVVAVPVLHAVNGVAIPTGAGTSETPYAATTDAVVQSWYAHNLVGFLLVAPFVGLMYYLVPKAAERPLHSYRLAILHFWTFVALCVWGGAHRLHATPAAPWVVTLSTLATLMLWFPAAAAVVNGALTLRGAGRRVLRDPVLRLVGAALACYAVWTLETTGRAIGGAAALLDYTDWPIASVHLVGMGWVGLMTFALAYWMAPRLFGATLWSQRAANAHFWLAAGGILLYVVPLYAAGLAQALMWRAVDEQGLLAHAEFVETARPLQVLYSLRVIGGAIYLAGAVLCALNLAMTWRSAASRAPEPVPFPEPDPSATAPLPPSRLTGASVVGAAHALDVVAQLHWHRRCEARPRRIALATAALIVGGSGAQLVAASVASAPPAATIGPARPYTPLELLGRDVYIAEGCHRCHTQVVRALRTETERYGPFSRAAEYAYDRPSLWGTRRIGPDLHRIGGKYTSGWHVRHLLDPAGTVPGSIMPGSAHLLERPIDFAAARTRVAAMAKLGAPYSTRDIERAERLARAQARSVVRTIADQEGPDAVPHGLGDASLVALVAYLQRLGREALAPGLDAADGSPEP